LRPWRQRREYGRRESSVVLGFHRIRWWALANPLVRSSGGGTRTHNLRINSLIEAAFGALRIGPKVPLARDFGDRQ
jgi:hypothetical protein